MPSAQRILASMSPVVAGLLWAFLFVRSADLMARGHVDLALAGDLESRLFLAESALFLLPALLLSSARARHSQRLMFVSAVSLLAAGSLYRLDGYLIAYDPVGAWHYFPAVGELMITIGLFSLEIVLYLIFIKRLPILSHPVAGAAQEA